MKLSDCFEEMLSALYDELIYTHAFAEGIDKEEFIRLATIYAQVQLEQPDNEHLGISIAVYRKRRT